MGRHHHWRWRRGIVGQLDGLVVGKLDCAFVATQGEFPVVEENAVAHVIEEGLDGILVELVHVP